MRSLLIFKRSFFIVVVSVFFIFFFSLSLIFESQQSYYVWSISLWVSLLHKLMLFSLTLFLLFLSLLCDYLKKKRSAYEKRKRKKITDFPTFCFKTHRKIAKTAEQKIPIIYFHFISSFSEFCWLKKPTSSLSCSLPTYK